MSVSRRELFLVLEKGKLYNLNPRKCIERLLSHVLNKFSVNENSENYLNLEKRVKCVLKVFVCKLISKWRSTHRIKERFLKVHFKWLDGTQVLPQISSATSTATKVSRKRGRPKKLFSELSAKTKSREVSDIVSQTPPSKLVVAAEKSLRTSGKRTVAEVIRMATESSPKTLKRMQQARDSTSSYTAYTPEEGLAFIVDTDLGKEQYIHIQREAKKRGANIYPPYNAISEVKQQCYPKKITVTESEAKTDLQELLDLTTSRLVKVQDEVIQRIPENVKKVDIYYKWGLDGSGGHSIYKQKMCHQYGDSHIILSTIVPLEISVRSNSTKNIYWKNSSTSSTRYCRPISFKIKKETPENMKQEFNEIQLQICHLRPTQVTVEQRTISFNHIPICTMLDGKTCNILSDTSSTQRCNICQISPKDVNNLESLTTRKCNTDVYMFGISILHAYLRTFEYLMHIAYKLEQQVWQARGQEAKQNIKDRRKRITDKFYTKIGLVVDQPKQGGGNSNDGNTARKFFDHPEKVAEITGIDEDLIKRFSTILKVLSSGHYINTTTLKAFCFETAEKCVTLYSWYKMPPSVHKILIHGCDIIDSLPLPVGQLSEDVLEASHKEYKYIRLFHARKTSRINTNTDIINMMLVSSDPIVNSFRKKSTKKQRPYPQQVIKFLEIPEFLRTTTEESIEDAKEDVEESSESEEEEI